MTIKTHNHSDKCQDYVHALEEERRKIQVFQRELPLCLELVTQAIEACKEQLSGAAECNLNGQSECSEQTCSDAPVLEEFIPLKTGEEQEFNECINVEKDSKNSKKLDWLRSVQLWNQTPDPSSNNDLKRNGVNGAFHPFKKEKSQVGTCDVIVTPVSVPPASTTSSSVETNGVGGGNKKADKEKEAQRKARRCWSTKLHTKFLEALQQLGGSHLATPKQIRELMKVDGLTNDEVKSHLQKYRLHTRRPSPSIQNSKNNTQTPQFVVVGGIWVPPEYAGMATTATSRSGAASGPTTSNGIYAPVAKLALPFQEGSGKPQQSDSEGGVRSHSSATSSSTHTTTASKA